MCESKTVSAGMDMELYTEQTRYVEQMRDNLLSFNKSDPNSAVKAIQNITILRVYHQLSRIIRYTELMDKLEDKMYESIDSSLDSMQPEDASTWVRLAALQEKLQKSMIESHKLLEPYLNLEALSVVESQHADESPDQSFTSIILDQQSREKLRSSAQEVLAALQSANVSGGENGE